MKKLLRLLFAVPLALSACGGGTDSSSVSSSVPSSVSLSSSTSSTATTSPSSLTTSTTSEPAPSQTPAVEPAPVEQAPVPAQEPVVLQPIAGSIWAPAGTG
ncbi:MAG: hypothetical protein ACTH98_08125, partial [Corynebacterium flavescens]